MAPNFAIRNDFGDFPVTPVVQTPCFQCSAQVWPLVRELRSRMPSGVTNNDREKKGDDYFGVFSSVTFWDK